MFDVTTHFESLGRSESKAVARSSRRSDSTRAKRGGERKATTFRLDPRLEKGLALLGEVRRVPLNRLVNEAVGEYLDTRSATVEAELEETLRRVKAYRHADTDFESAISKFARRSRSAVRTQCG